MKKEKKTTDFQSYLKAGYPALWLQTDEEERAIKTLYAESGDYACYSWDIVTGLKEFSTSQTVRLPNPAEAIKGIMTLPANSVIFLPDFHFFLKSPDIIRTIKNTLPAMKSSGRHLVIISPLLTIPPELSKLITVFDWKLPDTDELKAIAQGLIDSLKRGNPTAIIADVNPAIIEKGKGLTAIEFENAVARSLVEKGEISGKFLEDEKLQTIKKQGLMEIYPPEPADALQGMERLKNYIEKRKAGFDNPALPNPKGILLVGAPGTGKSLSSKVIAGVLGYPLIKTSPDNFKGGIVGESEKKTKDFWKTVKAISPCVVWMDEIEKLFGGVQSSSKTDGGTGSAVFGMFLQEMQELKEPVYFVATCNDINELLAVSQGAFIRRFDDVFFLDLPTKTERKQIIKYMTEKYYKTDLVSGNLEDLNLENWTGAEIEKMVIASLYEGIEEAYQNIHPIYYQNQEIIDTARQWALANARPANTPEPRPTVEEFFNRERKVQA